MLSSKLSSKQGAKFFKSAWMPEKPKCSDSKKEGYARRKRDKALKMKFIEVNPKHHLNIMVLDFDKPWISLFLDRLIDEDLIPMPNWITTNPETKHSQVGYIIDGFVSREVYKRERVTEKFTFQGMSFETKATQTFRDILRGLTRTFNADQAFNNQIMRNPLHPDQMTEWFHTERFKMKDLAKYIMRIKVKKSKGVWKVDGKEVKGRNDELFHRLRKDMYPLAKECENFGAFVQLVSNRASEINSEFPNPMSDGEVAATVRSVSEWTWGKFSVAAMSARQRRLVGKRWDKSTEERSNLDKDILTMVEAGLSVQEIADNLPFWKGKPCTYESAKKKIQRAKKKVGL